MMKNAGLRVPTKFGVLANCASWRIQAYAAKGVTCVECGLVGNMVAIEKNKNSKNFKISSEPLSRIRQRNRNYDDD